MNTPDDAISKKKSAAPMILLAGGALGCFALLTGLAVVGAIAYRNFASFACRAKASEAKTNLSALFTSEKVFYGEYGTYTSDLVALNWQPYGSPLYVYGFSQPGPNLTADERARMAITDYDESRSDTANTTVIAKGGYQTARMHALTGYYLTGSALPSDALVSRDSFLAAAVGDIDVDPGAAQLDLWTIDEFRNIRNVFSDCDN